jgi:hypothetical protein
MSSGPEIPVIYENPRFDTATPTLKPVFDRAIRFGAVLMLEWGTLTLIEGSPRYLKYATVVIAVLLLAVHESWPWLRMRNQYWYPALMGGLIASYVGIFIYAETTAPPASHAPPAVSSPFQLCFDGPCLPAHKKPGPEYLKEIGLGPAGAEPLALQGISVVTTDRLRMFVDYSEYRSGWMPRTRAFIGEFKEPVKNAIERLQLIYSQKKENAGANTLWWGDPQQNNAVTTPLYTSTIPAFIVRARVAIIGPSGEQHYYFLLVRDAANDGTYVGIIPEHDSGDWIEAWEKD